MLIVLFKETEHNCYNMRITILTDNKRFMKNFIKVFLLIFPIILNSFTHAACNAPKNLAETVCATSADVNWGAGGGSGPDFIIEWGLVGFNPGAGEEIGTANITAHC